MRVPCVCTDADYECDMNYVKNKGGDCMMIPDPLNRFQGKYLTEKEEDCALEGFYYVTQGYRKIPGNMCYGGVQKDPIKKACTKFGLIATYLQSKSIIVVLVLGAALYFGWPIIEAIILVLPIPDPKESIDRVKNAASSSMDMVSGVISSNT